MKISVITICLDAERFLNDAISSVLGQKGIELEYLIVDGGSFDRSLDIIRSWAARDTRLKWSSGRDRGIADAMNRGLERAQGEVVAFLHADDAYPEPTVLHRVASAMDAVPGTSWLTGGIREVDAAGRELRVIPARRYSYRRLLRNNTILHPATFVRREAFARVGGFDPALRYAMDYDLWLRLAQAGPPLVCEEILANFRVHAGSLSSANPRATLAEEYRVRRHYLKGPMALAGHALYHLWRCCRVSAGR